MAPEKSTYFCEITLRFFTLKIYCYLKRANHFTLTLRFAVQGMRRHELIVKSDALLEWPGNHPTQINCYEMNDTPTENRIVIDITKIIITSHRYFTTRIRIKETARTGFSMSSTNLRIERGTHCT